jgi:N-acetylglucosamine-6-phosphate deacetylase
MQETVAEVNYNDHSEWPTMRNMSGMSNKIGVASMLPTTDTEGRPLNNVHVPEEVANALTKDYSALMKAINKKKGN